MNRASNLESLLATITLSGVTALALAQQDLTLPPRLGDSPAQTAATQNATLAARNDGSGAVTENSPGGAELAAQPKARADSLEEVIVVGSSQWRLPKLPDLGSSWRQAHARDKDAARIHVGFTPLYEPGQSPTASDIFLANREFQRVGFLQLFQVRFGGSR